MMNNFTVEVVTSDNRTTQSCGVYRKADPVRRGGNYTFNCNSKQGRYVYVTRLQGSREQEMLTLCEVVIDGFIMITSSTIRITTSPTTTSTTTIPTTVTTSTTTTPATTSPTTTTSTTLRTSTSPTKIITTTTQMTGN